MHNKRMQGFFLSIQKEFSDQNNYFKTFPSDVQDLYLFEVSYVENMRSMRLQLNIWSILLQCRVFHSACVQLIILVIVVCNYTSLIYQNHHSLFFEVGELFDLKFSHRHPLAKTDTNYTGGVFCSVSYIPSLRNSP